MGFFIMKSSVPAEIEQYLSRTAILIRNGEIDVVGESFLLENVLKEIEGHEIEVMSDKKISKCLETVLNVTPFYLLRLFFHKLCLALGSQDDAYASLCCNPYASHVLECLFGRISSVEPDHKDPDEVDGVSVPEMPTLALNWLIRMGNDLLGMSSNRSASHVFRAFCVLFSGCKWVSKAAQNSFNLQGLVAVKESDFTKAVFEGFDVIVRNVTALLEKSSLEDTKYYCTESSSSASLQLLIALCDVRGTAIPPNEKCVKLRDNLVCALTYLPKPKSKQVVAEEASLFMELIKDSVGSRLMEVVVERCCSVHFETLWTNFFLTHGRSFAVDGSANFVVQKALQRAYEKESEVDIEKMVDTICKPNLSAIFRHQRYGVILQLVKAVAALEIPKWRKKIISLLSQSEVPSPLLVQLLGEVSALGANISRPLIDISCAIHRLGNEGTQILDSFWNALTEEEVRSLSCCRAWSEVAESFLKGHSSTENKLKFVRKMQSNLLDISKDKYGHHVTLTALQFTEGVPELQKKMLTLLKQNREMLCRNEWGSKLMKKISEQAEEKHTAKTLDLDDLLGKRERKDDKEKKKSRRNRRKRRSQR